LLDIKDISISCVDKPIVPSAKFGTAINYKRMDRRSFFKKASLVGLGVLVSKFPVWSNTVFAWDKPVHNIPEEKSLSEQWFDSLYEKGKKITYRKSKNELRYIGMPVGGLHSGTVYIGGDGRLWLWQIFNTDYDGEREGIEPKNVQWNNGKELALCGRGMDLLILSLL